MTPAGIALCDPVTKPSPPRQAATNQSNMLGKRNPDDVDRPTRRRKAGAGCSSGPINLADAAGRPPMHVLLQPIADRWIRRWARPSAEALAAVAGLRPATVITGGSEGIGLALAKCFAERGNLVVLVARDEARLAEAARAIVPEGAPPALTLAHDITGSDTLAVIDRALAAQGLYLDILVNDAGIGLSGRLDQMSPEDVDRLLATNVAALTRLMRHALPGMRARTRGGILNVASLGGVMPGPYQAAYYASKAYVLSLTEAVAVEMAGEGVRLTVVAPGPVDTQFHAKMHADNSLYRWLLPPLSADHVARSALRGFVLGRRVVVPGAINTSLYYLSRVVPHFLLLPIMAWLLAPREARQ